MNQWEISLFLKCVITEFDFMYIKLLIKDFLNMENT